MISSTPGYENQPEVLKLFKRSISRPNTKSVTELKSSNEDESRRKSIFYLAGGLNPAILSPIIDGTEDTEGSAVPTEKTKPISPVPKFLEELRRNEQFKFRQASLEALESEKDEE